MNIQLDQNEESKEKIVAASYTLPLQSSDAQSRFPNRNWFQNGFTFGWNWNQKYEKPWNQVLLGGIRVAISDIQRKSGIEIGTSERQNHV